MDNSIFKEKLKKAGKNILIIGSSEYGPTNEVTKVKSLNHLISAYGSKGSIIDAYKQIFVVNKNANINVIKSTGYHSYSSLNINVKEEEVFLNAITFKAIYSNYDFNGVYYIISQSDITFYFPEDFNLQPLKYKFENYIYLSELIEDINNDTINGVNVVNCISNIKDDSIILKDSIFCCNPKINYLYGGDDGLNSSKIEVYNCLEATYTILNGMNFDVIVIQDGCVDDKVDHSIYGESSLNISMYSDNIKDFNFDINKNFYRQLLIHCVNQLQFDKFVIGVIGFNKINTRYLANEDLYCDNITKIKNTIYKTVEEVEIDDYSFLVHCVAGDCIYEYGNYTDNFKNIFAALITLENSISSVTNIAIYNSINILNEFNIDNIKKLSDNGINTFRYSVLLDSCTCTSGVNSIEKSNSNYYKYRYIQNIKMLSIFQQMLHCFMEKYIGKDIDNPIVFKNLNDDVSKCFSKCLEHSVINEFDFNIYKQSKNSIKIKYFIKNTKMTEFIEDNTGILLMRG